jgi:hypothetical protein
VQNLDRLNDQVREESDGIHNTLSIIENLVSSVARWYIFIPNLGIFVRALVWKILVFVRQSGRFDGSSVNFVAI